MKRILLLVSVKNIFFKYFVEVTLNKAEYGFQRSDQPENVNFEPIIRGPKNDNFDWDQV